MGQKRDLRLDPRPSTDSLYRRYLVLRSRVFIVSQPLISVDVNQLRRSGRAAPRVMIRRENLCFDIMIETERTRIS